MSKTNKTLLVVLALAGSCCLWGSCLALLSRGGSAAGAASDDATLPPAGFTLDGPRQTCGDYSFITPPGMTAGAYTDGCGLAMPTSAGEAACLMVMLPARAAEGALDAQALAIMLGYFQANYSGVRDTFGGSDPLHFQERGVSGRGWEFVEIPPFMLLTKEGMPTNATARILLIKVGGKVFPIIGFDGNGRHCLDQYGDRQYRWLRLYYSLELAGAEGGNPLAKAIVGTWSSTGSLGHVGETYTEEGRYQSTSATRTLTELNATTVKETTRAYFGDGRYVVHGDLLTHLPDNGKPATTQWVRITTQPNSSTPSGWLTTLYQMKLGYDGAPYELDLRAEGR